MSVKTRILSCFTHHTLNTLKNANKNGFWIETKSRNFGDTILLL